MASASVTNHDPDHPVSAWHAGKDVWPQSIDWHDITLASPAENLALDEVLLEKVNAAPSTAVLRTWEPHADFIVVGRSNQVAMEVDQSQCCIEGVPIYRRCSGGGAVVVGPGCLAYAVVLPLDSNLRSSGVNSVTQAVMEKFAAGLRPVLSGITVCGTSDLVIQDRKFSGNSQRWLKNAFLHHGTILYSYDLSKIQRLLRLPSRQPEYRSERGHADFLGNVTIQRAELLRRIVATWNGRPVECSVDTVAEAQRLAASKYECHDWNFDR